MVVLDASAAVHVLTAGRPNLSLLDRLDGAESLHAPHLLDVEVWQALRGLERGRRLRSGRAAAARDEFARLGVVRYPHAGLAERVWKLRPNLSAYDATYVALAELLGCPLLTSNARLAKAPGHRAVVEVYGPR